MTNETRLGTLLSLTARAMATQTSEALRRHGLAPAQYAVLDLLDGEEPVYPTTMARRLEIETSTMAVTLNRLERDGLVTRDPDPHDRRGVIVSITEKARGVLPAARAAVTAVEDKALRGMSDADATELCETLAGVLTNIKRRD